jgi:molecular chaperone GrpE
MNEELQDNATSEKRPAPLEVQDAAFDLVFAQEELAPLPAYVVAARRSSVRTGSSAAVATETDNEPDRPPHHETARESSSSALAAAAERSEAGEGGAGDVAARVVAEFRAWAGDEFTRLRTEIRSMAAAHATASQQLDQLGSGLAALREQVSYLPPQLRRIASKVDAVSTAVADASYKALLLRLLGILDLIDGMRSSQRPEDVERHFEVLATQLRQMLEANGLSEIPTDQPFDPAMHHAIERIETEVREQHDRILRVVRPGFRTDQQVLRPAEVTVGYCPAPESAPTGQTPVAEPEEPNPEPRESLAPQDT